MAKRKTHEDGAMRTLNVRIGRETVDRFRVVAEADHRTVSQELRHLIEQRIAESESEQEAA